MELVLELSKENVDLACMEVVRLIKPARWELFENLLLLWSKESSIGSRLAYTRSINRLLFASDKDKLESNMKKFDWEKIYEGSFSVETIGESGASEYAGLIWHSLKDPVVDLKTAKTKIRIFFRGQRVFVCLLCHKLKNDFSSRRSHLRPEPHPSSLHPRLARALINLTGIKSGRLLDPMCGSGGILVEAGLMGLSPIGYDIDRIMLNRARANLKHYGINDFLLKQCDAKNAKPESKHMVCDLPYSKNTKKTDLIDLYCVFLNNLLKNKGISAVLVFPIFSRSNIDYEKMLSRFDVVYTTDIYIHKSLSKRIFVIS